MPSEPPPPPDPPPDSPPDSPPPYGFPPPYRSPHDSPFPAAAPASPGILVVSLFGVVMAGSVFPGAGLVIAMLLRFTVLRYNRVARVVGLVIGGLQLLALLPIFFVLRP